jgi:hypothetical protein
MEFQILEFLMNGEFAAYIALAFILYAIREASGISNKNIPIIAILLGITFSVYEMGNFEFKTIMTGIQYALLGVGTVAGYKYLQEKK